MEPHEERDDDRTYERVAGSDDDTGRIVMDAKREAAMRKMDMLMKSLYSDIQRA